MTRGTPRGLVAFHEGVSVGRVDGRDVLSAGRSRSAFALDAVAIAIAQQLRTPTTAALIAKRLGERFDTDETSPLADVEAFLERLQARHLLADCGLANEEVEGRRRYLDLLMRALTNLLYPEHELRLEMLEDEGAVDQRRLRDVRYDDPDAFAAFVEAKQAGHNWRGRVTRDAHTMVGLRRLENLERCASRVIADGVDGDFMEAGTCQGGASVFLRALQVAYGEPERRLWVADSFEGLPPPSAPIDREHELDFTESRFPWLAFTQQAVRDTFATYDLLSEQVQFIEGWFADTLAGAPVEQLALLRIDADLYSSTTEVLESLHPKVVPGGFVVVDDYWAFEPCKRAVDDYLATHGAAVTLDRVDWTAVCWRVGG